MTPEIPSDRLSPFRWPSVWKDPTLVRLLEGGPINCLLLDESAASDGAVAEAARQAGLLVRQLSSLGVAPLAEVNWRSPAPLVALSGLVWPSIKAAPRGSTAQAEAGPTGAPWIDSNSWVARLARVRAPGKSDRKSTRLNSSHANISYAVFCLKKKKRHITRCIVRELVAASNTRVC